MEKLSEILRNNVLILLIMFVVGSISGIMSIVMGWRQFYADYLSHQISIPIWFIFILVVVVLVSIVAILRVQQTPKQVVSDELLVVEGKNFGVQQINLSGKSFVNCDFDGTEFLIDGLGSFSLSHNNMRGVKFTMIGAAGTTLAVLTVMYKHPGLREIVDGTIENIKKGNIPNYNPPYSLI